MEDFELLSALGVDDICIYFQPIVSLQRFRVIGIEALTRGLKSGEFISPQELFSRAAELKISIEFDRFCRKLALLEFKRYYKKYNHLALFLNHDPTLLNDPNVILGYTATLCKDIGINPSRVVIEICESKVTNMKLLENFVTFQKKKGFLIALDDVGTHYSNLDRIPQLKPDILKIDRNLVQNSDKEWHKNKIVKAIIYLAREIRSIPIIEGVEKEEEIIENLKMGSEYFQGFYFCKPSPIHLLDFEKVAYKAKKVALKFRTFMIEKLKKRKDFFKYLSKVVFTFIKQLRKSKESLFDEILYNLIINYEWIECSYILNEYGIQITNTVFNKDTYYDSKNIFFVPAKKGDDLSSRNYFYTLIFCNSIYYVSEPYLSRATGNKCITISTIFRNNDKKFILCVDIIVDKTKLEQPSKNYNGPQNLERRLSYN